MVARRTIWMGLVSMVIQLMGPITSLILICQLIQHTQRYHNADGLYSTYFVPGSESETPDLVVDYCKSYFFEVTHVESFGKYYYACSVTTTGTCLLIFHFIVDFIFAFMLAACACAYFEIEKRGDVEEFTETPYPSMLKHRPNLFIIFKLFPLVVYCNSDNIDRMVPLVEKYYSTSYGVNNEDNSMTGVVPLVHLLFENSLEILIVCTLYLVGYKSFSAVLFMIPTAVNIVTRLPSTLCNVYRFMDSKVAGVPSSKERSSPVSTSTELSDPTSVRVEMA